MGRDAHASGPMPYALATAYAVASIFSPASMTSSMVPL